MIINTPIRDLRPGDVLVQITGAYAFAYSPVDSDHDVGCRLKKNDTIIVVKCVPRHEKSCSYNLTFIDPMGRVCLAPHIGNDADDWGLKLIAWEEE